MIELKGEGCREFENKNLDKSWMDFLEFFVIRLNANPTRIDLTIDDYDGSIISFEWLKGQLDLENFTTNFKSKKYTIHGNSVDGYSIQMGNRSSIQELDAQGAGCRKPPAQLRLFQRQSDREGCI